MEQTQFEFRKNRDVSDVIQGTFTFLRQEFKTLFIQLLKYAVPFLLLSVIASYYFQSELFSNSYEITVDSPFSMFTPSYFLSVIFSFLGQLAVLVVTFSYINQYIEKDESMFMPTVNQLIVPFIIAGILTGLAVVLGMFLFFIPGLFLAVTLFLIWPIITFEKSGATESFNRCFTVIKNNWWGTFGLLFLLVLILILVTLALSIPLMITGIYSGFFSSIETTDIPVMGTIWGSIISVFGALTYAIFYIAAAIQYFSIIERTEAPTLNDKIDQI